MSDERPQGTLLTAILACQQAIPTLKLSKDASNPHFKSKYITLERLMAEALPLLNANGLVWTTFPADRPGGTVLHYKLTHVATGQTAEGEMPLLLDKQNPQGLGSAITYSRRQSLMAVLGLTAPGEDDDENKASQASPVRTPVPPTPIDRPLNAEELVTMREAIKASGRNEAQLLAMAGVDDVIRLSHARAIKAKLE